MRIGIIGGLDRNEQQYELVAHAAGHSVEVHKGSVRGGVDSLENTVVRSDIVVIITDVNSHLGVQLAKRAARKFNRQQIVVKNLGVSKFENLLKNF